jgi:ADP-ribose pyrophosphatase YjhB (NUDIX family)
MPSATFLDPDIWYAGLAGVVLAAGALITDAEGRVLLVKPNYRELWALPGGICEFGEPPQAGCGRELAEELGLPIPVGRLLATDWSQPFGEQARPIMHFLFDGGQLADDADIVIQESELDGYRFTARAELPDYLPAYGLRRVTGALAALSADTTIYLPQQLS